MPSMELRTPSLLLIAALALGCTGRALGDDEGDDDGSQDGEYVKPARVETQQLFGSSVALSDDAATLVVGAPWEDGQAGVVYVFARGDDGALEQVASIEAPNKDAGDRFGDEVAISADGATLAVSAPREAGGGALLDGDPADNSVPEAGAVYVFARDADGDWVEEAYLKGNGEAFSFGSRMVLSGDGATLATVALLEPAVYVFARDEDGAWFRQTKLNDIAGNGVDYYGADLALSTDGDTLAIGGPGDDSDATGVDGDDSDDSAAESGAVRVFTRNANGAWDQQAYIKASNTGAGDGFSAVALSGSGQTLAVGALNERSDATGVDGDQADDSVEGAGAVYVFERDAEDKWSQVAYIKASNTGEGDHFGSVVRLSEDGATLAVSAYDEDSDARGFDGDEDSDDAEGSGAVYVFALDGDAWQQTAYVKATNADAGDVFGFSTCVSGDGATLAVGAPSEAGGTSGVGGDQGDNSTQLAGAAYVYDLSGQGE